MSTAPRVLVLPRLDDESDNEFFGALTVELDPQPVMSLGSIGSELPMNTWVAAVCLAIAKSGPAFDPIHLIARGEVAERLAAIAFAQRAARRPVQSYVICDAVPSGQFVDWPDAPVSVVRTNPLLTSHVSTQARLRGWEFVSSSNESAPEDIANLIRAHNP